MATAEGAIAAGKNVEASALAGTWIKRKERPETGTISKRKIDRLYYDLLDPQGLAKGVEVKMGQINWDLKLSKTTSWPHTGILAH